MTEKTIPQVGEYWYCQPANYDYNFLVQILEVLEQNQFRVQDADSEVFIASENELFKFVKKVLTERRKESYTSEKFAK